MNLQSNAKINLGLRVTGKRDDGLHDILSMFLEVDLADDVAIEPRDDGQILVTCTDENIPDGQGNLAYTAADALKNLTGNSGLGCDIRIGKQIPSGGGLGGGSSNAASVIKHLNGLWNLDFQQDRLQSVAERVGSDVPFFLQGGCAHVSGRGEVVKPVDFLGDPVFVLVDPGFRVSTPWAFEKLNIKLTTEGPYIRFMNSVQVSGKVDLHHLMDVVENDFLSLIAARFPSVQRILSLIRNCGAQCASMSGTGATLYGGFVEADDAHAAIDLLQSQGYVTHLCRPVRRLALN